MGIALHGITLQQLLCGSSRHVPVCTQCVIAMQHYPQAVPANTALQTVEIGIPADNQVAVACGYMTRAKHSLAHITLDELEQTLPLPEEKLLPLEDGEEYQYFLEVSI